MELAKISDLLKAGKSAAARKSLAKYLEAIQLTPEEAAKAFLEYSALFTRVNNDLLGNQEQLTEAVVDEFRGLNLKENILTQRK